jgi:MFS family permease
MALTVSRLLLGKILKIFSSQKIFFIGLFTGVVAVITLYVATDYIVILGGIILLGIGMTASFPVMLGYVAELYAQLSGTAFSVVFVIALTGNMIINYSMGVVAQTHGISSWPILLLTCLIGMIILLWVFLILTRNQLTTKS